MRYRPAGPLPPLSRTGRTLRPAQSAAPAAAPAFAPARDPENPYGRYYSAARSFDQLCPRAARPPRGPEKT